MVSDMISIHAERLQISEAPRKQNESISNRISKVCEPVAIGASEEKGQCHINPGNEGVKRQRTDFRLEGKFQMLGKQRSKGYGR